MVLDIVLGSVTGILGLQGAVGSGIVWAKDPSEGGDSGAEGAAPYLGLAVLAIGTSIAFFTSASNSEVATCKRLKETR